MTKNYVNIDNEKINNAFDILDTAMEKIFNELHLNMFEGLTILSMMESKIQRNNIDQYLLETCTRFQEIINKEDEAGR